MIDLYKPHYEISRTTSEITLLVFGAGLENAGNFLPLFLERIFALGSKMRRIFSLCFSEITLETSRNDARIFERNFVESSQGQRTKFAHFALITFSQYCNNGIPNFDKWKKITTYFTKKYEGTIKYYLKEITSNA